MFRLEDDTSIHPLILQQYTNKTELNLMQRCRHKQKFITFFLQPN